MFVHQQLYILLLLLLLFVNTVHSNKGYINSIYYLGSGMPNVYDFSKLDLNKVTHIKYAFANITGNKATLNYDSKLQGDKTVLVGHLGTLIKIKQQYRNIKVGISILGDFGSMVSSENGRNEFVNSVIDLIQQYGFDFIDLDWEFPVRGFPQMGVKGNPDDADYMLQLLKQFSQQFQSQLKFNCFITIALPSPEYYLSQYDINSIDPYIEYYNAMTYDFSGTFSATANFASNLYTNGTGLAVDESIKRMIKAGIPSDKLLMGIPAYATTFRDCKENKFPTTYNKDSTLKIGENGYIPINKVDWSKVDQQWNDELKANYGYFKDYNMLLSYDSIKSVTEKVNYIKDNKLKGVMVWALHQDFPVSDQRSLVSNSVNLLGQDNLENSQNNINYPNSKFENVKDSNFKVTVTSNSLILFSSNLFTYIFLVVLIFN